jgi:blocked-early-in-transport protein 1
MSDAYERERQNNSRLTELSAKVSALRGVTVDIYDNARSQDVIDNTVGSPSNATLQERWGYVG